MNRIVAHALLGFTGLLLSGCPIYPEQTECLDNYDCPSGYYCSDRGYCVRPRAPDPGTGGSGASSSGSPCDNPADCGTNEVCGADGQCHTGDCYFSGCVAPYECVLDGYTYSCVLPNQPDSGTGGTSGTGGVGGSGGSVADAGPDSSGGAAGTAGQGGQAGSGGAGEAAPEPFYCGNPSDCAPDETCGPAGICVVGTCTSVGCVNGYHCSAGTPPECLPNNSAACMVDSECTVLGAAYKCLGGMCTGPADQCADKTQCPSPDSQNCVEGKCVTACSGDPPDCPAGTACDTSLGVCTQPDVPCVITHDCADPALVCVAGACVAKCGTCDPGFVCVANGCVPDTTPEFTCSTEGVQDVCSNGSICLHHSCYITCTTNPDTCAFNPPDLAVCKDVTTSTGQYSVCGSNSNLGSECDPTAGQPCSGGKVCIDGFCR